MPTNVRSTKKKFVRCKFKGTQERLKLSSDGAAKLMFRCSWQCRKGQLFYELSGSRCSNCWQLCALGLWVRYLGLSYDTKRLRIVTNKTTDLPCNTFPLFARDSTLSQESKTILLSVACPIHLHLRRPYLEFHMLLELSQIPSAYEQMVSIPRAFSPHIYTTPLMSKTFKISFTDSLPSFLLTVQPILIPWFKKSEIRWSEFYV